MELSNEGIEGTKKDEEVAGIGYRGINGETSPRGGKKEGGGTMIDWISLSLYRISLSGRLTPEAL